MTILMRNFSVHPISIHVQSITTITLLPVQSTPERTDLSPSIVTGSVTEENLEFYRMALKRTTYLDVLKLPKGRGVQTPIMLCRGAYFSSDCQYYGC